MLKTVWILGAGFCRPLGGPLLADFFSRRFVEQACVWMVNNGLGDHKSCKGFYLLKALCERGITDGAWVDAEQFMDRVMTAPLSPMNAALVQAQVQTLGTVPYKGRASLTVDVEDPVDLARWCSHYVGAVCSSFLEAELADDIDRVPESWAAYCTWFDALDETHAILTYNYDRVLEVLATRSGAGRRAFIYNMHGLLPKPAEVAALIGKNETLDCIGLPGPGKKALVVGELRNTWTEADSAIRACEEIVIMGYSVPQGDAHSRAWLQRAIAYRASTTITLVLGAKNPVADRVTKALSFRNSTNVFPTDLYVEEFLTRSMATGKLQLR